MFTEDLIDFCPNHRLLSTDHQQRLSERVDERCGRDHFHLNRTAQPFDRDHVLSLVVDQQHPETQKPIDRVGEEVDARFFFYNVTDRIVEPNLYFFW